MSSDQNLYSFLSAEEQRQVIAAIKIAERKTSGEIRLHLQNHCHEDVLDHAAFIFEELAMHECKFRNGVLFYVAVKDKKFAILGDAGINSVVPDNFWESIKDKMSSAFKSKQYAQGIIEGIEAAGEKLKTFFPFQEDDVNELSDEISFGK